jgi:F-type H+-transporting ATPase subunit b
MLELNYWFFVLAANFLFMVWLLNRILFKPLLKLFKERDEAISGSLEAARDLEAKREETIESLKKEFAAAGRRAREKFEALKAEGIGEQKRMLEKASAEASRILEKAREELRAESGRARKALREDVERFSEEIVGKLVEA